MTDEEKTHLRIEAAKAMGWTVAKVPFEGNCIHITPPDLPECFSGSNETELWQWLADKDQIPNPFDNPGDCEALLVETLSRGWIIRSGTLVSCILERFSDKANVVAASDSLEPLAAYREAITRACIAAWKAEENAP